MLLYTTRFGTLRIENDDIIRFPEGLLGLRDCQTWVLLADAENDTLGWLQSTLRPDIALAVVSPRCFVPTYQLRLPRSELAPLQLGEVTQAQVLAIVGKNDHAITLNLKAPLVINLAARTGRQVIASGDLPIQYELQATTAGLKKTA
ncbi:MAG: flagellar assembly protein FliW [Planctomycetaceae bacterium]|nr:flagellar assembly protein FliW [Planctomycetaceae bacterium]